MAGMFRLVNGMLFTDTSLLEVNVNATAASTFIDQVDFYIIPSELSVFLLDHFKSLHVGNKWLLLLQKSIDVEYIYQEKVSFSISISLKHSGTLVKMLINYIDCNPRGQY